MSESSLASKVKKAGYITVGLFFSYKFVQLVSNLILTRLLFPEAFGLMALINVVIQGVQMLSDIGLRPAIISMKSADDEKFLNTAWTLQIIRGGIIWLLLVVAAYPLAQLYNEPELNHLIMFVSLAAGINGFASINLILAERDIDLLKVAILNLVVQVISVGLTILFAYFYKSVWSLAVGQVIGAVVNVVLGHLFLKGHQHALAIDKKYCWKIINFGGWIFLATLFTYFSGQGIRALEGFFLSATQLGILAVAYTIAMAISDLVQNLIMKVVFPALAKINNEYDETKYKKVVNKIRWLILAGIIPAFAVVCFLSEWIIDLLYDDRYAEGGWYLGIISIGLAFAVVPMVYQNSLLSMGKAKLHFYISAFYAIVTVVSVTAGFYSYGIAGMLYGGVVARLLYYFATIFTIRNSSWTNKSFDFICIITIVAVMSVKILLVT